MSSADSGVGAGRAGVCQLAEIVTKNTVPGPLAWPRVCRSKPVDSTASWALAEHDRASPLSRALVSTNKGTSMTAVQDWLNIRPFDPREHIKAIICALRGGPEKQADAPAEPVLIQRGVERC